MVGVEVVDGRFFGKQSSAKRNSFKAILICAGRFVAALVRICSKAENSPGRKAAVRSCGRQSKREWRELRDLRRREGSG